MDSFERRRCTMAAEYEDKHRFGLSSVTIPVPDVLLEEQRTGEIFPGRPDVRPRIGFCSTSKDENAHSCHKHYFLSQSHSPGIFTVQCVCSSPKLLGLSVMLKCEGVSTALSVLLYSFKVLPKVC